MGVQDLVRWFLPKDDEFFALMETQGQVLHRAAKVLAELGTGPAEDISKRVQQLEHEGDGILHAVEDALAKTFVTPIDREDIANLANRLDDILDKTNLTARSFVLFGMDQPSVAMQRQMALLVACAAELEAALGHLHRGKFAELSESARRVKALEKEGDTVFRDAVAHLFRDPSIDAKELLRQKELLEDLEEAVDFCEDTGEFLAHVAVKHA